MSSLDSKQANMRNRKFFFSSPLTKGKQGTQSLYKFPEVTHGVSDSPKLNSDSQALSSSSCPIAVQDTPKL